MASESKVNDTVQCIVCEKVYARDKTDQYQPLKHFEDSCICNVCSGKEQAGWPKP